jgi:hypothetical protein
MPLFPLIESDSDLCHCAPLYWRRMRIEFVRRR